MPRWLTLPAASITMLLAFSAYGAPLGTLELNYQPLSPALLRRPNL